MTQGAREAGAGDVDVPTAIDGEWHVGLGSSLEPADMQRRQQLERAGDAVALGCFAGHQDCPSDIA